MACEPYQKEHFYFLFQYLRSICFHNSSVFSIWFRWFVELDLFFSILFVSFSPGNFFFLSGYLWFVCLSISVVHFDSRKWEVYLCSNHLRNWFIAWNQKKSGSIIYFRPGKGFLLSSHSLSKQIGKKISNRIGFQGYFRWKLNSLVKC